METTRQQNVFPRAGISAEEPYSLRMLRDQILLRATRRGSTPFSVRLPLRTNRKIISKVPGAEEGLLLRSNGTLLHLLLTPERTPHCLGVYTPSRILREQISSARSIGNLSVHTENNGPVAAFLIASRSGDTTLVVLDAKARKMLSLDLKGNYTDIGFESGKILVRRADNNGGATAEVSCKDAGLHLAEGKTDENVRSC